MRERAVDVLIEQAEMLLRIAAELDDPASRARLTTLAEECRRTAADMRRFAGGLPGRKSGAGPDGG